VKPARVRLIQSRTSDIASYNDICECLDGVFFGEERGLHNQETSGSAGRAFFQAQRRRPVVKEWGNFKASPVLCLELPRLVDREVIRESSPSPYVFSPAINSCRRCVTESRSKLFIIRKCPRTAITSRPSSEFCAEQYKCAKITWTWAWRPAYSQTPKLMRW
jgi:hypothetical protein